MSTPKGVSAMPAATSAKAPSFSGEREDLLDFLEAFEDLADENGLTDEQKCKYVVRYMSVRTKHWWTLLPAYATKDFTKFKESILAQYPGAEKGVHYTPRDLEQLVAKYANSNLSTETQLMDYYHDFLPVANWLVTNKKISDVQRNRHFWEGLPDSAQDLIDERLEKMPNYTHEDAMDFEKVLEAGRYVFAENAVNHKPRTSRVHWDSDEEDKQRPKDAPQEVHTKNVHLDKSAIDEIEELGHKMHSLNFRDIAYSSCYIRLACLALAVAKLMPQPRFGEQAPVSGNTSSLFPGNPQPHWMQGDERCFFCGLSHIIRNCPTAEEYIRAGRVIKENHYFFFPDRSRIQCNFNGTIQQAVDKCWGSTISTTSTPATGANTTAPSMPKRDPPPHMPAATSTAFISETYFLQCSPVADNHVVVVEVEKDEENQEAEVHAITRAKSKALSEAPPSSPTQVHTHTNSHQGKTAGTDTK